MQNTERQKFEDNWKSAFDGAEMTPSDNVWNSIELDLAGQESATMKKRVVFYQRLAAATVIFALLTGTYAFYTNYNTSGKVEVVQQKTATPEVKEPSRIIDETPTQNPIASAAPIKKEVKKEQQTILPLTTETIVIASDPVETQVVQTQTIDEPKKETVVSPVLQTAPLTASLEEQKSPEEVIRKDDRARSTWLALGAAAGNYSPSANIGGGMSQADAAMPEANYISSPALNSSINQTRQANSARVGSAYTVGLAVGKKFGRFVLQTGVNLANQRVDYTSYIDTHSSLNVAKAQLYAADNASFTTPYTVSSSMQVVSIPVQAGYMIIDRRLGWQVNTGFSPDFFLKNTLVDKSGQRQKFTENAGGNSPYRSVNWSGLLNTELSYRIGTHYRISLVPGVRYSFTSILKDDTGAKPLILDIGFRFRYTFE